MHSANCAALHGTFLPVGVQRQMLGLDLHKTVDVSQLQFVVGAVLGLSTLTVDMPQIQFIAGVCGHSPSQQRQVRPVPGARGESTGSVLGSLSPRSGDTRGDPTGGDGDEGLFTAFCGIFRPPSSWTLRPRWRGRRESDSQVFCILIRCSGSDDSARGGDTSSCRSLQHWPR